MNTKQRQKLVLHNSWIFPAASSVLPTKLRGELFFPSPRLPLELLVAVLCGLHPSLCGSTCLTLPPSFYFSNELPINF